MEMSNGLWNLYKMDLMKLALSGSKVSRVHLTIVMSRVRYQAAVTLPHSAPVAKLGEDRSPIVVDNSDTSDRCGSSSLCVYEGRGERRNINTTNYCTQCYQQSRLQYHHTSSTPPLTFLDLRYPPD